MKTSFYNLLPSACAKTYSTYTTICLETIGQEAELQVLIKLLLGIYGLLDGPSFLEDRASDLRGGIESELQHFLFIAPPGRHNNNQQHVSSAGSSIVGTT